MRLLSGAKDEVVALGFPPGGTKLVAVIAGFGSIYCWDVTSTATPLNIDRDEEWEDDALQFTPDGQHLITADSTSRIHLDLTECDVTRAPPIFGLNERLRYCSQTPDGTCAVMVHSTRSGTRMSLWRGKGDEWKCAWTLGATKVLRDPVALAPNGDRLAHITRDFKDLVIRETETGAELGRATSPYTWYRPHLRFRLDGEQILAVHEMTLVVWSVPKGGMPQLIRNDSRKHFTSAAYHPNSRYLFTTSNDTTVLVWDTTTWEKVKRFTWNIGRLRSVAVNPDGTLAAVGSDKGQIVVWDVDL